MAANDGGLAPLEAVDDPGLTRHVPAPAAETPAAEAPAAEAPVPGRRRWWAPAPDPVLPEISPRRAYTEVVLVYLAFFLVGIIAAGLLLGGHAKDVTNTGSWGVYLTAAVDQLSAIGLALAVVLLLASRRGVTARDLGLRIPRRDDGRVAVARFVRLSGWCFVAIIVGNVFVALLQTGSLPDEHTGAPELIFSVFQAAQAGVIEELVVLAFVVVTLRQAGRPWWEVTTVALVLRAAYHIYYGPGVVGILVWAALFYWIYVRSRELLPLMVCHGLWDAVAFLGRASTGVVVVAELGLLALWISGVILWLIERNNRPAGVAPHGAGPYGAAGPFSAAAAGAPYRGPGAGAPYGGPGEGAPYGGPVAGAPYGGPVAGAPYGGPGEGAPYGGPVAGAPYGGPVAGAPLATPAPAEYPPPGWHPDPAGHNRWRWWDGHRWTEHVSPP